MHSPSPSPGLGFNAMGTLPRALFLALVLIGCTVATAATTAAEDKAKAPVTTPSNSSETDSSNATSATGKSSFPTVTITGTVSTDDKTDDKTDADAPATKKSHRRGHIHIGDDDFESFNDALHTAPWVVGLAFLVAGSFLLTPVFLLIGIIWYKLRKTRLQNEALLKLAEKGVMPPAQAVDAMMSGGTPEEAAAAASSTGSVSTPVYQQAIIARRRAVWSDLRRGVILSAIGLSFVFYSIVESGSASWVGLVLLFLGIGYVLLWWFEDRHLQGRGGDVDAGKS